MKKNNKGFVLVETLIVSVFVLTTLVFLFVEFRKVKQGFDTSFTYNTVTGMYAASNFASYIKDGSYETIVNALKTDGKNTHYIDLSECPAQLFTEPIYCGRLKDTLNMSHMYFTDEDLSFLLRNLNSADMNPTTKKYIKTIKYDKDVSRYRLIIEFKDNTYASIKVTGHGGL